LGEQTKRMVIYRRTRSIWNWSEAVRTVSHSSSATLIQVQQPMRMYHSS